MKNCTEVLSKEIILASKGVAQFDTDNRIFCLSPQDVQIDDIKGGNGGKVFA